MGDVRFEGPIKASTADPNVRRAIDSSILLEVRTKNNTVTAESGNVVNLTHAQRQLMGVSDTAQIAVTDSHALTSAQGLIQVKAGNKWYTGTIRKLDDKRDLAFIEINTKDKLPAVNIASGDDLAPGDLVYSVSHPLGTEDTVVNGGTFQFVTSKKWEWGRLDRLFPDPQSGKTLDFAKMYQDKVNTLPGLEKDDAQADWTRPLLATKLANKEGGSGGALFNSKGEIAGVLEAVEPNPRMAAKALDTYTPAAQIRTFADAAPMFKFNYTEKSFTPSGTTAPINVAWFLGFDRIGPDKRPPFNSSDEIVSKLSK